MTLEFVFNELKKGTITLDDTFAISEYLAQGRGAVARIDHVRSPA